MNNNDLMQFTKLVPFLGQMMGSPFEIVLFDVTKYALPIIASDNIKDSTGEKARGFVRDLLGSEDIRKRDHWTNHAVMITPEKISKMSAFFVRDEENAICAALVVCMRCDDFFKMEGFLSSLLTFNHTDITSGSEDMPVESERPVSLDRITEYIREFGVDPNRTNHDEKSEIICDLYDMGVFDLKGAVAKTAQELGISVKSVYRYLSKIKKARV